MKKVIINGRFLTQKPTGVNRFAYEICRALQKLKVDFILVAPKKGVRKDYDISNFQIEYIEGFSSHLWDFISLPKYLRGIECKYLLLTFTGLGPIFDKNHIVTVHDLAFLENPSWYSKKYYYFYKLFTPILIRRAKLVLTVSEFSKKEILKYYPFAKEKIEVIYNAISDSIIDHERKPIPEKYFLAVSSIDPRKNFARLIKAFKKANIQGIKLYIIGKYDRVFAVNNELNVQEDNVVFLGYVDNEELARYYSNAIALIYPSLYEGFGIPPMEAMANKCPVLLSDIPVFHEIYGDSVRYFNPYDVDDISNNLKHSIGYIDPELYRRMEMIVSKYSWEKSANKILKILECL